MKQYFLLLTLIFSSLYILAQTDVNYDNDDLYSLSDTLAHSIDIFAKESPIHFTLKSDFKKFRKEKYKGKYQKAQLIFKISDSTEIDKEVRIKARGEFRRKHCSFPPIRLNFRNKSIDKKNAPQYYKLKMVTHCSSASYYRQYVFKEYLCYKLYNILTDKSFRVRLIDVTYFDTGKKKNNEYKTIAFFIEDLNMLAERNNAFVIKNEKLSQRNVEKPNMMQAALFQFMIGNGDWSIPGLHNMKLLKSKDYNQPLAWTVPYDYDYCGIVNASYAIPDEERLGIEKVTERVYLGLCEPEIKFKPIMEKFKKHKDEFYDEINNFEYLEDRYKKEMILYLDEFYELIEYKTFYERSIKAHCKKLN